MRKILYIGVMLLLFSFLNGCGISGGSSSVENSSGMTSEASAIASAIKEDSYYQQLIAGMPAMPKENQTIEEALLYLSSSFDLLMLAGEDTFDDINQYSIENMSFFAMAQISLDYDELDSNENYEYLYREEWMEKYVFYYFNYKIDCSKLSGWSAEEKGVRYGDGFGGWREPKTLSFTETEKGYEIIVGFLDPDRLQFHQEEILYGERTFKYDRVGNRYCLSAMGEFIYYE